MYDAGSFCNNYMHRWLSCRCKYEETRRYKAHVHTRWVEDGLVQDWRMIWCRVVAVHALLHTNTESRA